MAARKNLTQVEKTRERIRASQLVNRLIDHALGKVELSTTQVRAAEVLIKKIIPDLKQVEMTIEGGEKPVQHEHTINFVGK